jgi:hypothetical protein
MTNVMRCPTTCQVKPQPFRCLIPYSIYQLPHPATFAKATCRPGRRAAGKAAALRSLEGSLAAAIDEVPY